MFNDYNKYGLEDVSLKIPISFCNKAIISISSYLDESINSYGALLQAMNRYSKELDQIKSKIKELIVCTPSNIFSENEEGTIKDQIDKASEDLFSELYIKSSKYERLRSIKDIVEFIADDGDKTYEDVFELLINTNNKENEIEYCYYNGDKTYDYNTLTLLDRNVNDIRSRIVDHANKYNLNYNNLYNKDNKGKYIIEILNDKVKKFEPYITSDGVIYYNTKEEAEDVIKDIIFDISPYPYMEFSYIKKHENLFIGYDQDSFIKFINNNKEVFTIDFINRIYPENTVRFNHNTKLTQQDIDGFISFIQSRLFVIINNIFKMNAEEFNALYITYMENKVNSVNNNLPKDLNKILVKVIDDINSIEIINNINNLGDYEFLNTFVESCLEVLIKPLYRIMLIE